MPTRSAISPDADRSATLLAEAVRRVHAAIPDEVDLPALRRALETERAKGTTSLVALMKVGRRRALDRIARRKREAATG